MTRGKFSFRKGYLYFKLLLTFLRELIAGAIHVAISILTKQFKPRPAILAVPLELETEAGIAILANLDTLTPGTTSLHISDDRKTLYIHVLDASDPDEVIAATKRKFERLIQEIEQC